MSFLIIIIILKLHLRSNSNLIFFLVFKVHSHYINIMRHVFNTLGYYNIISNSFNTFQDFNNFNFISDYLNLFLFQIFFLYLLNLLKILYLLISTLHKILVYFSYSSTRLCFSDSRFQQIKNIAIMYDLAIVYHLVCKYV
jgi:hypothetical protein